MRFAYNSNGFQSHRLAEALDLLVEAGYSGLALTLDHMHLDPLRAGPAELRAVAALIADHGLAVSIETGARFVLDPRRKHRPSWIERDAGERARRSKYIECCLNIGAELEAESVVLFSGINSDGLEEAAAWDCFLQALNEAQKKARTRGLTLALEPEPGHLVSTLGDFRRCAQAIPGLRLALDVGHVPVTEPERSIPDTIREFAEDLATVHIEDSHGKVHEHLPFGQGNLDHRGILAALAAVDYQGLVAVELSRHSHAAHELIPESIQYLRKLLD